MAKGGRNRKDRARHPNGHLKPQDNIIPEGIAMRRMAVLELSGAERDQDAENPGAVCEKRGLILKIERQAGDKYEQQHLRTALRARTPQACIGNLQPSGEGSIAVPTSPGDNARAEAAFLASREALQRAGSRAFHLVENIVIHHHWPRFLDTERRRPPEAWTADARDLSAFRAGLEALVRVMKLRGEKGDNFGDLIWGLEQKLDRRPSDVEVATALMRFSVVSLLARRDERLKRAVPR